ncbi:Multiple epidermal growth factor-like domains protein 10 [Frankliniella fusca]|uniref:Multiple epidermal growth factor-like domains protein 10 n=1 Tax=Frankliniella fusca TaxID=407009 RepID=A0AAE1LHK3_9NEOP|nr:Multiple epidermal growth factor-like domains protein 10 [Frankliniella fusca]
MQYDPETQRDGVHSACVRCFMALKIQASGWPADCEGQEQKDKYVADTLKYDGVVSDPAEMVKNPALRTLAKLMCNSFWGKFGEKTMRPKTHFVYRYEQLLRLITDHVSRPGEPDPPTGTHLGDLSGQLEEDYGPGSFIVEFVSGSPKNYAYAVAVRGDTSNIKYCIKKIVTRDTAKKWQAVNSKRRRVGDITVPHGYNAWEMAEDDDQELLEAMELLADA